MRDGGAGLQAKQLGVDEAIIWPQQGRLLERGQPGYEMPVQHSVTTRRCVGCSMTQPQATSLL